MKPYKLRHILKLLRKIHYSILFVGFIACAVIALFALRANNQRMIQLRSAVFTADKANGNIEGALRDLRSYVYSHMNTNLSSGANAVKPPIQLKYHYERLETSAKATYNAATADMLNTAQTLCIAQYPGTVFSQPRLQCAKAYAEAHPVTQLKIPEDQYKFDFASPPWSPDLAGWSILGAAVFLILFIIRFLSELAIRHQLQE